MFCSIRDINFGRDSKKTLEQIEGIYRNGSFLSISMSGGVIIQLFVKNNPLSSAYSISQFDFETYSQSVASVSKIVKDRVRLATADLILFGDITRQERDFWKCVQDAH